MHVNGLEIINGNIVTRRQFKQIRDAQRQLLKEQENVQAWKTLAALYDKTHSTGLVNLSLAEAELYSGNYSKAIKYAKKAKKILKNSEHTDKITRADDIISYAKLKEKQ